jgi:hypothetical protein
VNFAATKKTKTGVFRDLPEPTVPLSEEQQPAVFSVEAEVLVVEVLVAACREAEAQPAVGKIRHI